MDHDDVLLPTTCVRLLNDKLFDKKKTACREIEIMAKEFNTQGKTKQIRKLIRYLVENFIDNSAVNSKIGGLIAVSSVAIALDTNAKLYLDDIVKSICTCTYDNQRDVKYRALESLYNVAKSVRSEILVYLDTIFNIIIRLGEDGDASIREASLLMDKLLKDIVIENPCFDIPSFIGLIRERIYVLTPNARKLILSWISFLDSLPDIDLLVFIEDILDGLLEIACDPNLDIRRTAENILEEFFVKLQNDPKSIEFKSLIKIILIHVQKDSQLVQNISLKWLNQFIMLGNKNDLLHNSPHILGVILPCFSYPRAENEEYDTDNFQKKNTDLAKSINENLMNLVTNVKSCVPTRETGDENLEKDQNDEPFKISKILIVLLNELELGSKTSPQTKIAILEWIYQIYDHLKIEIDEHLEDKLFKILLTTLYDSSDDVVLLDLKVFCRIIFKYSNEVNEKENYRKLIKPLIELFHKNPTILQNRGSFIICRLCHNLDAQQVYITFSDILLEYDHKYICSMVYILNTILLISKELTSVRNDLKNMKSIESKSSSAYMLFDFLYKTWCYSSVSAISLCFLTKRYKLASELILHFGNININIDILLEIDQLIQMLESPIFTSLRLDLLEPNNNYYLRKSLYGLLMLLPQSEAFHLLRKRLQCIPDFPPFESKMSSKTDEKIFVYDPSDIDKDFAQKLKYFIDIQQSLDNNNSNSSLIPTQPHSISSSSTLSAASVNHN
ncbi:protein VAC14 homolog [Dermatophagoides pteronyssinus]|uniref:protein VAC14 homolog n=1 Tax=Dermatophagoides pteronyssinus TaxID=6956 RepID=UPI003F678D31